MSYSGNELDTPISYGPLFEEKSSIFRFKVPDMYGNSIPMSSFKGKKAYIIVNVSSTSAFTNEYFEDLQQLYEKHEQDLEIIAFPCDDFNCQRDQYLENAELQIFSLIQGVTFPVMGSIFCENGLRTHPLFEFLKKNSSSGITMPLDSNFCKFLCDSKGRIVGRYSVSESFHHIEDAIDHLCNFNNRHQENHVVHVQQQNYHHGTQKEPLTKPPIAYSNKLAMFHNIRNSYNTMGIAFYKPRVKNPVKIYDCLQVIEVQPATSRRRHNHHSSNNSHQHNGRIMHSENM